MKKNHPPYSHSPSKTPPSPRLLRSRSENTATSTPNIRPRTSNSYSNTVQKHAKRLEENKEKITPKYRLVKKDGANFNNRLLGSQNATSNEKVERRIRSTPNSPSAWALSPGRANLPFYQIIPKSPSINYGITKNESTIGGGRRSGDRILNFFGIKKKVSQEQKEEFHQFRILQNRLLQWRFANARVKKSTRAVKTVAETKLLSVWLRMYKMRNSILEKRIQIQKLSDDIKIYENIVPQMCLLKEWAKFETRNTEAICRLTRKMSSISTRLPLVRGAKGDVVSMNDALNGAIGTINNIQVMFTNFLPQVEKICFLVTELALLQNQQEECLNDLQNWVSTIVSLQAEERCLRAHLLQLAN